MSFAVACLRGMVYIMVTHKGRSWDHCSSSCTVYMAGMRSVIRVFGLASHSYADDGQIYSSCFLGDINELWTRFLNCISAVTTWAEENRLALNSAKTEFIWICNPIRRDLIIHEPFKVGNMTIAPYTSPGVILDETLSLEAHINSLMSLPITENRSDLPLSLDHCSDPTCLCIRTDEVRLLQ